MSLTKQDLSDIRTVVVDAFNESFEQLSTPRFDALETRMDGLQGRMSGFESEQRVTNRQLSSIESKLAAIEADIETMKNDIMALYELVSKQTTPLISKSYDNLSQEDTLRSLHAQTLKIAEQLNIKL